MEEKMKKGETKIIKCDMCGKEYKITAYQYNKYKTHCCSKECANKIKSINNVTTNCVICGKEITMGRSQFNRHNHHCCSQECDLKRRYALNHKIVECEYCGKEFEKTNMSPKRFCSTKCQNEWQKGNVGIKNSKFDSQLTKCDCCGKEFYLQRYKLKINKNNFAI